MGSNPRTTSRSQIWICWLVKISDPGLVAPPRDPDGVATFCRPATRATQRPCQPWPGLGKGDRAGGGRGGVRVALGGGAVASYPGAPETFIPWRASGWPGQARREWGGGRRSSATQAGAPPGVTRRPPPRPLAGPCRACASAPPRGARPRRGAARGRPPPSGAWGGGSLRRRELEVVRVGRVARGRWPPPRDPRPLSKPAPRAPRPRATRASPRTRPVHDTWPLRTLSPQAWRPGLQLLQPVLLPSATCGWRAFWPHPTPCCPLSNPAQLTRLHCS